MNLAPVLEREVIKAPCDMCGLSYPELYSLGGPNRFCLHCAHEQARYQEAYTHLEATLRRAVRKWMPTWGELPAMLDFDSQFNAIGRKLLSEYLLIGSVAAPKPLPTSSGTTSTEDTTMTQQTAVIPFHNSALRVAKVDGQVWIAVRPICEHLGIDSKSQIEKLRQDNEFQLRGYPLTSNDGKLREMMCLPQEQILGWLYTISSNKISEQAQPILKAYRLETTKAINDYWTVGQATRLSVQPQAEVVAPTIDLSHLRRMAGLETAMQEVVNLIPAVIENSVSAAKSEMREEMQHRFDELAIDSDQVNAIFSRVVRLAELMGGEKAHRSAAWRTFKSRFGLAAYRDLRRKDFDQAITFLDGLLSSYSKKA